ncbi:hypothetical protein ACQPYH_02845 [Kribbella sp. CA-245084]|uniref:hypothetical protein n=1 Tax=Kribbella sp. CA-245084 TaxID=3239940 RepID=UPI003D92ADFC
MRFLKVLPAGAVMITAVFALGAPSAYAVGCVGESCYNKGPVSMGCTKDQRSIANSGWSLQVYYSPACQAVWAIAFTDSSWDHCVSIDLERARSDRIVQGRLTQELCPEEASDWTNMFPKGWYFRAVYNDPVQDDFYTPWVFR